MIGRAVSPADGVGAETYIALETYSVGVAITIDELRRVCERSQIIVDARTLRFECY